MDCTKIAFKLIQRRTKPYPVYEYIFKSKKYKSYVYRIAIDGNRFWHAHLDGVGYNDDFYSDNEDEAALWIYKNIKKYFKRVKRDAKKWDNKKRRRHLNWQKWLINYQHHQYPKRICDLIIY